MKKLLTEEDLNSRKFFHKPVRADGEVLPHASYVKEFIDERPLNQLPVRLAHKPE